MKYPIIIALPLLMLADYYLTLLGAVLRDKKYSKFVVIEEYELNPKFQEAIKQRKLINVKHLLFTILLSTLMICLAEFSEAPHEDISFILGMLLVMYSVIIGIHVENILFFWYIIKREGQLSGQIYYTYEATLLLSVFRNLLVLLPLIIIYSCEKSSFVLGGICGVIVLEGIHFCFLAKMKKKKAAVKSTEPPKTMDEGIK
jgi:hypothetical protein